jgi:hypothetical protein
MTAWSDEEFLTVAEVAAQLKLRPADHPHLDRGSHAPRRSRRAARPRPAIRLRQAHPGQLPATPAGPLCGRWPGRPWYAGNRGAGILGRGAFDPRCLPMNSGGRNPVHPRHA